MTIREYLINGDIKQLRQDKTFISLFPKTKENFISEVKKLTKQRKDIQEKFEVNKLDINFEIKYVDFTLHSTDGTYQYIIYKLAEYFSIPYDDCENFISNVCYDLDDVMLTYELVDTIYNDDQLTHNIGISLFVEYNKNKDKVLFDLLKFATYYKK